MDSSAPSVHPQQALAVYAESLTLGPAQEVVKTDSQENAGDPDATTQEDSHGRALWALGTVLGNSEDAGLRGAAGRLFEAAASVTMTFTSPRAWAFSVLGMQAYLDWEAGLVEQLMRDGTHGFRVI